MTVLEARIRAEDAVGKTLAENEFQQILSYTRHKAGLNGKGEDYVPLMLYDEIRNYVFEERFNMASQALTQITKQLAQERRY